MNPAQLKLRGLTLISKACERGLTLIELLIVIVIISSLVIPLLVGYRGSRTNQALYASANELADKMRNAHVFAREAKDEQEWGIESQGSSSYSLSSGKKSGSSIVNNFVLEPGVTFDKNFTIWFDIGTGELKGANTQTVTLIGINGKRVDVTVLGTGVVEVGFLQ